LDQAIDLDLRRCDTDALEPWMQVLTLEERARAERYRQGADRRRFVVGRGVLRTMLGRRLGRAPASLAIVADLYGKPTLADAGDIAFNVSHAGHYVLVAVGGARAIGVDVERCRLDLDPLEVADQVFTPAERAEILTAPLADRTLRAFRQWTFKEAVAKALGLGLSLDPMRFEIAFAAGDGAPQLKLHGAPELGPVSDWRLQAIPVEAGYCAALAVRR
jgi:4'-phosphopantetheinyl transferase